MKLAVKRIKKVLGKAEKVRSEARISVWLNYYFISFAVLKFVFMIFIVVQ